MFYFLKNKNSVIHSFLIICLYAFNSIFPLMELKSHDLKVLFLYIIILNFCTYFFVKKGDISLKKIFYLFVYIFFGLAPLIQYKTNTYFFNKKILDQEDFFLGGFLTLAIITVYSITSFIIKKNKVLNSIKINIRITEPLNNKLGVVIFLLALLLCFFLSINFDFQVLYSQKDIGELRDYNYNVVSFFRDTLRLIPLFYLISFKLKETKQLKFEFFLILIVLVFNFPTAISRFQVGIVYLPIIYVYLGGLKKFFIWIFLMGLLIVFPYLHHFRYNFSFKSQKLDFIELFSTSHFDSFQNTISAIKLNIITNGEQLFGSLFFFIPHSLWEGKTGTSSILICDRINYNGYCNLAVSYFGEGYINFGYLGVFLFLLILITVNEILDKIFLESKSHIFKSIFLCLVFYEFYLLRGSLESSIEKLAILFFSFMLYIIVNSKLIKFK